MVRYQFLCTGCSRYCIHKHAPFSTWFILSPNTTSALFDGLQYLLENFFDGEGNDEGGAFAGFALGNDFSLMFARNALGNGQAEARSILFGGKKRLENAVQILFGNADASIVDIDLQETRVEFTLGNVRGDGERAMGAHGFQGIQEQVHDELLQLRFIAANDAWRCPEIARH